MENKFKVVSKYKPTGDQPQAIEKIAEGFQKGLKFQTLLGVTGSGKTFTMANIIEKIQKPTLVIAHNKTLAAQLYNELKEFFPENAVEYFVSYYDYYQPEAYVPSTDTYIEKDSSVNDEIDKLRHSATAALVEREDVIVVASVSCIYGLGDPEEYYGMMLSLRPGMEKDRDEVLRVALAGNAGYAGNNNNILSLHQRRRGGMAQLINFIIDRGILFDIGIRTGYIRLRLIIVIIADEILHRIFGEKLLQLVIKLCRKGFIVRNDQGRLLDFLNDICHGKGFARTCNPQQGLEFQALLKALRNFFNRLRLITGRFIFRYHLKFVLHFSSSR